MRVRLVSRVFVAACRDEFGTEMLMMMRVTMEKMEHSQKEGAYRTEC